MRRKVFWTVVALSVTIGVVLVLTLTGCGARKFGGGAVTPIPPGTPTPMGKFCLVMVGSLDREVSMQSPDPEPVLIEAQVVYCDTQKAVELGKSRAVVMWRPFGSNDVWTEPSGDTRAVSDDQGLIRFVPTLVDFNHELCAFLVTATTQTVDEGSCLVPMHVVVRLFEPTSTPIPPTVTPVPPTDTPVPPTPTPVPTATPTATDTPVPSPTPTATPAPPTATSTPRPIAAANVGLVNLRAGPGTSYPRVRQIDRLEMLDIVGRDSAGDWWQVCCVDGEKTPMWVIASLVTTQGDLRQVPIVVDILPSSTPVPKFFYWQGGERTYAITYGWWQYLAGQMSWNFSSPPRVDEVSPDLIGEVYVAFLTPPSPEQIGNEEKEQTQLTLIKNAPTVTWVRYPVEKSLRVVVPNRDSAGDPWGSTAEFLRGGHPAFVLSPWDHTGYSNLMYLVPRLGSTATPTTRPKEPKPPTSTLVNTPTPTATLSPTSTPTAKPSPTSTSVPVPTATPTTKRPPTSTPTKTRPPTSTPTTKRPPTSTPRPSTSTPVPGVN